MPQTANLKVNILLKSKNNGVIASALELPSCRVEAATRDQALKTLQPLLATHLTNVGRMVVQLEDYFNFLAPDDIRLKDTRIGIETILFDYLFRVRTPEEIASTYPSLTLEQVYATILYYLHNKAAVDVYMTDWLEWAERMREEQRHNPPPVAEKLRRLRVERGAMRQANGPQVSHG